MSDPFTPDEKAVEARGLKAYRAGDFANAESAYRELIARRPEHPRAHMNLAMTLRRLGRRDAAEASLRTALGLDPQYAHAWNGLGAVLAERGDRHAAADAFTRAHELAPGWVEPARNLGRLHLEAGRARAAAEMLECAVHADPAAVTARFELAVARALAGDAEGAIEANRAVLAADPRQVGALVNLGQLLVHQRRQLEAGRRCFERALEVAPQSAAAHLGLAEIFRDVDPGRAAEHFRTAREIDPRLEAVEFELVRLRAAVCDWSRRASDQAAIPELVERLGRLSTRVHPFHLNRFPVPPELHRRAARLYSEQLEASVADDRGELAFVHRREARSRLRVGYLSSDFRRHAVGELVRDLFRHHDRDRVEVWAYSLVNVDDPVRRSIEAGCDRFEDLFGVTDRVAARRLHEDGVDVLVDLSGYTVHARPGIPALRPAPVQVHWLGYLDTLGCGFTPWILADPVVLPEALAAHYDESVVYLPDAFTAAAPIAPPAAAPRPEEELPDGGVVLCNFCHPSHLGPETFEVWMRILRRTPEGVLWLYDAGREEVRANLQSEALHRGIDPGRLVFAGKVARERFLARLAAADLFLDTLGYNAGATGVAALGAGLPVVTCPGATYLGRMGASLCRAAGCEETVTSSVAEYEELACALAGDPARRRELSGRLAAEAPGSPLFDLPRFAAALESAYEELWRCHIDGRRPRFVRVGQSEVG